MAAGVIKILLEALPWLLLGVLIVAVLAIVFRYMQRRASERLTRLERLQELLDERHLTEEDEQALLRLAALDDTSPDAYYLATNQAMFDRLSRKYLDGMESDSTERVREGNALLQIREMLFYAEQAPGGSVIDSRSLQPNMMVRVVLPDKPEMLRATLVGVTHDTFAISTPVREDRPVNLQADDMIEVLAYLPGAGGYRFRAPVHSVSTQPSPLVRLHHTTDVDRIKLREWERVPTDVQVRFHHLQLSASDAQAGAQAASGEIPKAEFLGTHRGTLRNISMGGMSIRAEVHLEESEYVGISLDDSGGSKGNKIDLLGQVVGASSVGTTRQKMYNLHVRFVGMDDLQRDRLMLAMFRLRGTARGRGPV